jgi:DNA-binding CsgD family transcriptional regulator
MRTPARQNAKGESSGRVENHRPEDLVRLLLDCVATSSGCSAHGQEGSFAEEVIFDIDVNGARYLLVRLHESKTGVQLSPREREIVRMVAMGHPNKIIADVLGISSWTVCTHLRRIFAKVGVGSRAAMVARLHERPQPTAASTPAPTEARNATSTCEEQLVRLGNAERAAIDSAPRPRHR